MRILHTSDWHLGRRFHGASLVDDQAEAVDRIVEITSEGAVDLVVIAGDLYDRAFPPAEAVDLFDDAVSRLRSTGATVVAISGNHDSGVRVGVYDRLLAATGVTIRGDVSRAAEPVMVESADGGPPVAVYPLPYLDPTLAAPLLAPEGDPGPDADADADADRSVTVAGRRRRFGHDALIRLATDRMRADLAGRAGARSVVVAHTFVAGGQVCESERELTVGNVEEVGVDAFAGFDYVALGHLHGSQERNGPALAYSGTPLPYSFSEADHTKSVRLVDLAPDGAVTVEVVALGVGRLLRTIEGPLDDLLSRAELAEAEAARVRVVLTDRYLPLQAMAQLRGRFPYAVELRHCPEGVISEGEGDSDPLGLPAARAATPSDLATRFWAEQHGTEPDAAESELLGEAFAAATARRDS